MAQAEQTSTVTKAGPVLISRTFPVRRGLVFKAWTDADRIKRWFCPEGYTVPEAEVDFRPGGVFAVCMRSPEGQDHWSRGTYTAIESPERIEFISSVFIEGAKKFTASTAAVFQDSGTGTRLTVRQEYEIFDQAFAAIAEGAPEGWDSTLARLEREAVRIMSHDVV